MSAQIKEALLWTVVFIVIAIVIAAGVRVVDWITEDTGTDAQIWKAAVVLVAASAGGGKAVQALRHNGK